jgi:hypothetical protein
MRDNDYGDKIKDTAMRWLRRTPLGWRVAIGAIALIVSIMYPAILGFFGFVALVSLIIWGTVQLVRRQRATKPESTDPEPATEPEWTEPELLLPVGRTLYDLESATVWVMEHNTDDVPAGTRRDFPVGCGVELAGDFAGYTVVEEQEDEHTEIVWITYVLHRSSGPDLELCATVDGQTASCCSARHV